MKRCLQFFTGILLFLTLNSILAANFTPPDKAANYVNDYAHVLNTRQAQSLDIRLKQFDKSTSNQIVVAIIPTLAGQSLEETAVNLYRQWGIGTKKNNNGVLLLISIKDHKIRIEVGYGLEGALTDALSGQIIRNEIAPAFKRGDYDAGIVSGTQAIIQATKGEYKADTSDNNNNAWIGHLFIFFFFFIFFILPIINRYSQYKKLSPAKRRKLNFWSGVFLGSGMGGSSGSDDFGGADDDDEGGGFSGGGGSSGGGGASGGW